MLALGTRLSPNDCRVLIYNKDKAQKANNKNEAVVCKFHPSYLNVLEVH
jgi:hypothetical protein